MTPASTEAQRSRWPRIVLIAAAALELVSGIRDFPILFGDLSEIPGPGLGGWIITAKIALHPIVAGLALILAVTGRLRGALAAFAVLIVMTWLSYLPSVAIHGLDFKADGFRGVHTLFQIFLAPLLAIAVIALAMRNQKLTLATLLAVLPTIAGVLAVLAFAISVAIYGF